MVITGSASESSALSSSSLSSFFSAFSEVSLEIRSNVSGNCDGDSVPVSLLILGFHMQICSKSEWGSTSTVMMFMLYWREQMIGNCTYLLRTKHEANTYSEHLIHSHDDVSI